MKKAFIEPEMQRIEIDLRENIAASSPGTSYVKLQNIDFMCPIQFTGKSYLQGPTPEEIMSCLVTDTTRSIGMTVPVENLLPYARH